MKNVIGKAAILVVIMMAAVFATSCDKDVAVPGNFNNEEPEENRTQNNDEPKEEEQGGLVLNDRAWDDFLAALQRGVWEVDRYTLTMDDGTVEVEDEYVGSDHGRTMMLRPDGTGHIFSCLMFDADGGVITNSSPVEWRVSEDAPYTIELYSENLEAATAGKEASETAVARTTLTLVSFDGAKFEMRGMQPHVRYTAQKRQPVECLLEGRIDATPELVARFEGMVEPDSPECHASPEEFEAFMNDVVGAVWGYSSYDMTYSNGDIWYDVMTEGGSNLHAMAVLPDGTARYLIYPCCPDEMERCYEWLWTARPELFAIELCDPDIEPGECRDEFSQSAGRTMLKLISYKDGDFVMRGLQPFAYSGGITSSGAYWEYITVRGGINKSPEAYQKYLAYEVE